jgi:hypothetical protein
MKQPSHQKLSVDLIANLDESYLTGRKKTSTPNKMKAAPIHARWSSKCDFVHGMKERRIFRLHMI